MVTGTSRVRLTSISPTRFIMYSSFSNIVGTTCTPKCLPFSSLSTSAFILAVATIFMAFVIFRVLDTDLILLLMSFSDSAKPAAKRLWKTPPIPQARLKFPTSIRFYLPRLPR